MRDRSRSSDRKPAVVARVALALPLLALVAACGDSLESRNEAAGLDPRGGGGEMRIVSQNSTPSRSSQPATTRPPNAQPTAQGFEEEGSESETIEVDAGPETFIDSAQGFDPTPMDDTVGFDPSPMDMGGEG